MITYSTSNQHEASQTKAIELLATDNTIFSNKYQLIAFFDSLMHRIVTCYAEEDCISISHDYRLLYALKEGFKGGETLFWTNQLPVAKDVLCKVYKHTKITDEVSFFEAIDELLANLIGLYCSADWLKSVKNDYYTINTIKQAIKSDLKQARQVSSQTKEDIHQVLRTIRKAEKQAL